MCQSSEKISQQMNCNCKQICCKMQNASLKSALFSLKDSKRRYQTRTILDAIYNALKEYSCLPGTCLLNRVRWVIYNISTGNGDLCDSEKTIVKMLISELEIFLENSSSIKKS